MDKFACPFTAGAKALSHVHGDAHLLGGAALHVAKVLFTLIAGFFSQMHLYLLLPAVRRVLLRPREADSPGSHSG